MDSVVPTMLAAFSTTQIVGWSAATAGVFGALGMAIATVRSLVGAIKDFKGAVENHASAIDRHTDATIATAPAPAPVVTLTREQIKSRFDGMSAEARQILQEEILPPIPHPSEAQAVLLADARTEQARRILHDHK
jgi:hypothetical protein